MHIYHGTYAKAFSGTGTSVKCRGRLPRYPPHHAKTKYAYREYGLAESAYPPPCRKASPFIGARVTPCLGEVIIGFLLQ